MGERVDEATQPQPSPAAASTAVPSRPGFWKTLAALLIALPIVGLIGVVAAELVPDGRIIYNVIEAEQLGLIDGVDYSDTPLGTRTGPRADCMVVTVGLGDRGDHNVVERALLSPTMGTCSVLVLVFDEFVRTGELNPPVDRYRYWHGSSIGVRPAMSLFGFEATMWLTFAVLAVAVSGLAVAVARRFGWLSAALLVAPTLLTTDMIIGGLSIAHTIGFTSAWLAGWAAIELSSRFPGWRAAVLVAVVAGSISAYLDLMTTMPGGWALTAMAVTLGSTRRDPEVAWRSTVAGAGGFLLGLGWMWAAKWFLVGLVVGMGDVFDNVRSQVEFRTTGEWEFVDGSPLAGPRSNLDAWWDQPLTPAVVGGIAVVLGVLMVRGRRPRSWRSLAISVAVLIAIVLGWYALLSNHSQIHFWFTFRSLAILLGAVACLVASSLVKPDAPPSQPATNRVCQAHSVT